MKFAKEKLKKYPVSEVCRLLGVSRSDYYRKNKQADNEEKELEEAIINCFKKNHGNYGRIRIKKALLNDGISVSENKIFRVLRKKGLEAKSGRTGKPKKVVVSQRRNERI